MRRLLNFVKAIAALAVAVASVAGCGGEADKSDHIQLSGASARDKRIAADLNAYIKRNYGNAQKGIRPPENLPPRQRRAIAELSDNVAELRASINRIVVSNTVVTVYTKLNSNKEGLQTARLICTVIYGADVADLTNGHQVIGRDSALLAKCSPSTSPLE